jgi:osmotically-inducible protein OsmY
MERLADLYYELEPRLVAVGIEDIVLASRVQSALRSAGLEDGVRLSVRGRRVQLRGTVPDATAIQQVETLVWAVPGVRKVVNHLRV